MNAFVRHHSDSIHFGYSCFDRMLCNLHVPALQWHAHVYHFLKTYRQAAPVTPAFLRRISNDYHHWLNQQAGDSHIPIVEPPPQVRREEWVQPYFQELAGRPGVAVILKCRERARVAVSFPKLGNFVNLAWRFVNLYYFYLQDPQLGRLFLRLCPYFPFNAQVCLNGHEWLACQLRHEGIAFAQRDNAFVDCAAPERLQALADSFGPEQIVAAIEPCLRRWLPFFTPEECRHGYRHRLYMTQMEYCHNLIFDKRAALDRLFARLLDLNRGIGQPDKQAIIFGRKGFRPDTRTGETTVKITCLKTPVIRTGFKNTSVKQYVKDGVLLRTEAATSQLNDLSVKKDMAHLAKLRQVLDQSNERYLQAQQDVLATYLDRGQLQQLRQPTVSGSGRRTPGMRLDDPRLLALLGALTCFRHLVSQGCFRTSDLLEDMRRALDQPDYKLSQLRYDLAKLRGKGLVVRRAGSQRYQLSPEGYRIAVLYEKLYHRLYAPLTAGILEPDPADNGILTNRQAKLDRLYRKVDEALQKVAEHLGLVA